MMKRIISFVLSIALFSCCTFVASAQQTGDFDYINEDFDSYTSELPSGWFTYNPNGTYTCEKGQHESYGSSLSVNTAGYVFLRNGYFEMPSNVEALHSHVDIKLNDHNSELALDVGGSRLFRINVKGAGTLELGNDGNAYIASGFAFDTQKWYGIDSYYNILTRELEMHISNGTDTYYFRDAITDTAAIETYSSLTFFIGTLNGNPNANVEIDNVKLSSIKWDAINHNYIYEKFDSYTSELPSGWFTHSPNGTYSYDKEQHDGNGSALSVNTAGYVFLRNGYFNVPSTVEAFHSHIDLKLNDYNSEFALDFGNARLFRINIKGQGALELGNDGNAYIASGFAFETQKWYSIDTYYNILTRELELHISDGIRTDYFRDVITDTSSAETFSSLTFFIGTLNGNPTANVAVDNVNLTSIDWDSINHNYIDEKFESGSSQLPSGWFAHNPSGAYSFSKEQHNSNDSALSVNTAGYVFLRNGYFNVPSTVEAFHTHIDLKLKDYNSEFALDFGNARLFRINIKGAGALELGNDANAYIVPGFAFDTEKWYSIDTYYNILNREVELHVSDGIHTNYFRDVITDTSSAETFSSLTFFIGTLNGNPNANVAIDNVKLTSIDWNILNQKHILDYNFDDFAGVENGTTAPNGWGLQNCIEDSVIHGYAVDVQNGDGKAVKLVSDGTLNSEVINRIDEKYQLNETGDSIEFDFMLEKGNSVIYLYGMDESGVAAPGYFEALKINDDGTVLTADDTNLGTIELNKWYRIIIIPVFDEEPTYKVRILDENGVKVTCGNASIDTNCKKISIFSATLSLGTEGALYIDNVKIGDTQDLKLVASSDSASDLNTDAYFKFTNNISSGRSVFTLNGKNITPVSSTDKTVYIPRNTLSDNTDYTLEVTAYDYYGNELTFTAGFSTGELYSFENFALNCADTVKASVYGKTNGNKAVLLVAAIYNTDRTKLLGVDVKKITPSDEAAEHIAEVEIPANTTDYKASAYLWTDEFAPVLTPVTK